MDKIDYINKAEKLVENKNSRIILLNKSNAIIVCVIVQYVNMTTKWGMLFFYKKEHFFMEHIRTWKD